MFEQKPAGAVFYFVTQSTWQRDERTVRQWSAGHRPGSTTVDHTNEPGRCPALP